MNMDGAEAILRTTTEAATPTRAMEAAAAATTTTNDLRAVEESEVQGAALSNVRRRARIRENRDAASGAPLSSSQVGQPVLIQRTEPAACGGN
jgi:hypothetical protein